MRVEPRALRPEIGGVSARAIASHTGERRRYPLPPLATKLFRYSMASVVALAVGTVLLVFFDGAIGIGPVMSSTLATAIAAVPNYQMNRKWAWGRSGQSHITKEIIPFWVLAFAGWATSTCSVRFVQDAARSHDLARAWTVASVVAAYAVAFGFVSVAKFLIFNRWMFVEHRSPAVLSERVGGSPLTST